MKIDIQRGRYWDRPWSIVDGCTPCSPGCEHCWSAAMTHRFHGGRHLTRPYSGEFTGDVEIRPDRLDIPLRTRKPTVFSIWNDIGHENVPIEFFLSAYERMSKCPQHTFLCLTKRPAHYAHMVSEVGTFNFGVLPNVYHGLTAVNQQEADEKIPVFLQVPGKKFLSIEPMLGPVDLEMALEEFQPLNPDLSRKPSPINAVILGAETGPGARPIHPDWVRSVRDQCAAAGVPFFFKQWGEYLPENEISDNSAYRIDKRYAYGRCSPDLIRRFTGAGELLASGSGHEDGGKTFSMYRVGRKVSDRILDGRTHDDLPWVQA